MLVYVLSDPRDGAMRYVGKTSQPLKERLRQHIKNCHRYTNHCARWVGSLKKLGIKPVIEVVEECLNAESLDVAERFYINYFRSLGFKLTNLAAGGAGTIGVKPTDTQRAAMSCRYGGRPIQDQFGTVFISKTEAARKLGLGRSSITQVLKGRERHAGGYTFSYVGEPLPVVPTWTEADSIRHSRERGGRAVVDQNGTVYQTAKEACLKTGVRQRDISNVLRGRRKSTGGYIFKHIDSEPNLSIAKAGE